MAVYLGIDWSKKSHAVTFINQEGGIIAEETIGHTAKGFARLEKMRCGLDVCADECVVGIESSHTLLIDWLWSHGYSQVYVIPPAVTASRQATYRQSKARTDSSDAYLIANLLRTDLHLLHPWRPDSPSIQALQAQVSLRMQLVAERIREQNRLAELVNRYYPAFLQAFSLDTDVGLAFLQRYPTPEAADRLTWTEFQAFAKSQHYASKHQTTAFAALQTAQPEALAAVVESAQPKVLLLARRLAGTRQLIKETEKSMQALYAEHPDASIYNSLPGVGEILAPALLSKLGDDRERFPTPSALQAFAGTAPVTEQSGQRRTVRFRQACDHDFRAIVQQWAKSSLNQSPWAVAYFTQSRDRGHSASRVYRGLANRWLAILWKLWQSQEPYDQDLHLQRVKARSRPRL
jgi:transposase